MGTGTVFIRNTKYFIYSPSILTLITLMLFWHITMLFAFAYKNRPWHCLRTLGICGVSIYYKTVHYAQFLSIEKLQCNDIRLTKFLSVDNL